MAKAKSKSPSARSRQGLHRLILDVESRHRQAIETEKQILHSAQERLVEVAQRLKTVAKTALTNDQDSQEYQDLIVERGRLQQTVAKAERHLSHGWH